MTMSATNIIPCWLVVSWGICGFYAVSTGTHKFIMYVRASKLVLVITKCTVGPQGMHICRMVSLHRTK